MILAGTCDSESGLSSSVQVVGDTGVVTKLSFRHFPADGSPVDTRFTTMFDIQFGYSTKNSCRLEEAEKL
jgi:hypothetical protein